MIKHVITAGLTSRMLLQLMFEVAPEELDALEAIVLDWMSSAAELSVPLEVQLGRGEDWNSSAH